VNSDGTVQLINPKGCKVLGYSRDEIVGKNWFENFIPTHLVKSVKEVAQKVFFEEIEPVRYHENEIVTKSGQLRLIAWHNSVLKNEDGEIIGTLSSGVDITESRKAEEALKNSKKRFEDLVNLLPEVIFETDEHLQLKYANKKAYDLFKYTKEDLRKGLNALDMLVPEEHERVKRNFALRQNGEDPGPVEYIAIKKDGTTFPVLLHANTIKEGSKITGIRGIIVNISYRKQIEDEILVFPNNLQAKLKRKPFLMPIAY
jgi:PAS domain S-box-containing protein